MYKELATSIVLSASKMEQNNNIEVICVIYGRDGIQPANIIIYEPEYKSFGVFEKAYNTLIRQGHRDASEDKKNFLNNLKDLEAKKKSGLIPITILMKTLEHE